MNEIQQGQWCYAFIEGFCQEAHRWVQAAVFQNVLINFLVLKTQSSLHFVEHTTKSACGTCQASQYLRCIIADLSIGCCNSPCHHHLGSKGNRLYLHLSRPLRILVGIGAVTAHSALQVLKLPKVRSSGPVSASMNRCSWPGQTKIPEPGLALTLSAVLMQKCLCGQSTALVSFLHCCCGQVRCDNPMIFRARACAWARVRRPSRCALDPSQGLPPPLQGCSEREAVYSGGVVEKGLPSSSQGTRSRLLRCDMRRARASAWSQASKLEGVAATM